MATLWGVELGPEQAGTDERRIWKNKLVKGGIMFEALCKLVMVLVPGRQARLQQSLASRHEAWVLMLTSPCSLLSAPQVKKLVAPKDQ